MDYKKLSNILFPNIDKDTAYYEDLYPERKLDDKAIVTRFAPSPTGFIHMGSLYTAFVASLYAKQTNGVCYLRIEDTDQERSIDNGKQIIIDGLSAFGLSFNEGINNKGKYGPYIQSERINIYKTYVKDLVTKGLAYPCFCSPDELADIRKNQETNKDRIGYYGKFTKCRNLAYEEIERKIKNHVPYVIRLKSPGNYTSKIECKDLIKGKIIFPENDLDIVLLKSNGLPTYHFAHAIDDHLMHTTHVIRGEEWLSSLPVHYQLFKILHFKIPK
ncbi:MAG: glutamate--tRNA ligase family protein, partial [Bacilli bacterium]|nr:glutamate--tRNA ligase family protein [Bacilli bacterium]